jgi:hypothetical protein
MEDINLPDGKSVYKIVDDINSILETNLTEDELHKVSELAVKSFQVDRDRFDSKPTNEVYGTGHLNGFYAAYSGYAFGDFKEKVEPYDERTIVEDIPAEVKHYAFEAILNYYRENEKTYESLLPQELYIIAYRNGYEQGKLIFENVERYRQKNKGTVH